jgi:hypothetical protein
MSSRNRIDSVGRWSGRAVLAGVFVLQAVVFASSARAAAQKSDAPERRVVVGTCVTPAGSLLQRQDAGKGWKALKEQDPVSSGDLLVALPGAAIDAKNGGVRLSLLADLAQISPYPVLESAVVLHDNDAVDLAFTLDRGRVDVTNRKDKGPAQVQVRVRNETWELSLLYPGTRVALELYGRWPRGVPLRTWCSLCSAGLPT